MDRIENVITSLHVAHLNEPEKNLVLDWAQDFSDIFHLNAEILSVTPKVQHRIPTTDDIVIAKKQYRQPPEAQEQISVQIDKQLKSGIIAPSKSPSISPVLIVPKKLDASGERKYRVVIDYRALNEKVIGDAYPLPNITDILERLGKAQYHTSLYSILRVAIIKWKLILMTAQKQLFQLQGVTSSINECLFA